MKYHQQRFRHDPSKGVYGDCFRTVIACLLDLELDDVPHVADKGAPAAVANAAMQAFLADRGLTLVEVPFAVESANQVLSAYQSWNPRQRYLLSGMSTRGVCHVVVCRDDLIEHDPHPDGGALSPIDGYFWIGVLGKTL